VPFADVVDAPARIARFCPLRQILLRGKTVRVLGEVFSHFAVGGDCLPDQLRLNDVLFQFARRAGGAGDEPFDLEFIRVDEQADEGLLIVGIATDIGKDKEARLVGGEAFKAIRAKPGER
jgi:hypothetical protein